MSKPTTFINYVQMLSGLRITQSTKSRCGMLGGIGAIYGQVRALELPQILGTDPKIVEKAKSHVQNNLMCQSIVPLSTNFADAQDVRIPSFKTILENGYSIIGLPQSLYYRDEYKKKKEVTEIKSKIALGLGLGQVTTTTTETVDEESDLSLHHRQTDDYWWNAKPSLSNQIVNTSALDTPEGLALSRQMVTFMWREKESLEEASRLYPFVSNILVPDMAFQLGPYQPIRKHPRKMVDVIIFLRKDHESKVNMERNQDSIRAILPKKGMTFRIVDWDDRRDLFDTTDTFFTDSAIQLLSLGKVVVCDRLHAAVLAYLSGLPFVYIDQVSGKVTKTLTAAFEGTEGCLDETLSRWSRATTLKEALSKASQLIDSEPSLQEEGGGFLRGVFPW